MKKRYDVIVIGAGSVGQPTAFFLAKEGVKVLCIDKNASSGQGQNKAAIGGSSRNPFRSGPKFKFVSKALKYFLHVKKNMALMSAGKKVDTVFQYIVKKKKLCLKEC